MITNTETTKMATYKVETTFGKYDGDMESLLTRLGIKTKKGGKL